MPATKSSDERKIQVADIPCLQCRHSSLLLGIRFYAVILAVLKIMLVLWFITISGRALLHEVLDVLWSSSAKRDIHQCRNNDFWFERYRLPSFLSLIDVRRFCNDVPVIAHSTIIVRPSACVRPPAAWSCRILFRQVWDATECSAGTDHADWVVLFVLPVTLKAVDRSTNVTAVE